MAGTVVVVAGSVVVVSFGRVVVVSGAVVVVVVGTVVVVVVVGTVVVVGAVVVVSWCVVGGAVAVVVGGGGVVGWGPGGGEVVDGVVVPGRVTVAGAVVRVVVGGALGGLVVGVVVGVVATECPLPALAVVVVTRRCLLVVVVRAAVVVVVELAVPWVARVTGRVVVVARADFLPLPDECRSRLVDRAVVVVVDLALVDLAVVVVTRRVERVWCARVVVVVEGAVPLVTLECLVLWLLGFRVVPLVTRCLVVGLLTVLCLTVLCLTVFCLDLWATLARCCELCLVVLGDALEVRGDEPLCVPPPVVVGTVVEDEAVEVVVAPLTLAACFLEAFLPACSLLREALCLLLREALCLCLTLAALWCLVLAALCALAAVLATVVVVLWTAPTGPETCAAVVVVTSSVRGRCERGWPPPLLVATKPTQPARPTNITAAAITTESGTAPRVPRVRPTPDAEVPIAPSRDHTGRAHRPNLRRRRKLIAGPRSSFVAFLIVGFIGQAYPTPGPSTLRAQAPVAAGYRLIW